MSDGLKQAERLITIATPLGEDKLIVRSLTGSEEMSRLFQFHLDFVSEDGRINAKDIVGKSVTVAILQSDGVTPRYFNGFISRFGQLPSEGPYACYRAEMVPWLWFLTRTADCRIFQDKTVPEIIEEIFEQYGFSDYEIGEIRGVHEKWDYCVQYRERAFHFLSRLMEQEGIFYFFRHENGKHVLVLADHKGVHKPCSYQSTFRMEPGVGGGFTREEDVVSRWEHHFEFRSGKWAQSDYNFQTPSTRLMTNTQTIINLDGNQKYEVYDFPGEYKTKAAGEKLTKIRMEEEELPYDIVHGEGDCRPFTPGSKFTLKHHERKDQNSTYVLTSVSHQATQGGLFGEQSVTVASYKNAFTCIPQKVLFRPARVTPKPVVHGNQTAVVVGPKEEEVHTDKYGRVKVQFHWDRRGQRDDKSSCWVRVAQVWAGKNWGAIWIPRIGQEVVVGFLEGDPDQPIIVSSVYNAEQMPPYDLPANKTRSGIKSRSSMRGSASDFNELRFEDKKGNEEIYLHAEKDFNAVVENNRTIRVDGTHTETIEKDTAIEITKGNHSLLIDKGNSTIVLKMGNLATTLKMGNESTKIDLGKSQTEAMQSIELKVGQSSVKLDQMGVTIKGMTIKIEGQIQVQVKGVITQVNGDGLLILKGGLTMIN